ARQDRRGQAREVLRRAVPARAGLHQGRQRQDQDQGPRGRGQREDPRTRGGEALRAVPGRRGRVSVRAEAGPLRPVYRRVVLKLSGEALAGNIGYGIDPPVLERVAAELREVTDLGVEMAVVIGGGNIFRGVAASA